MKRFTPPSRIRADRGTLPAQMTSSGPPSSSGPGAAPDGQGEGVPEGCLPEEKIVGTAGTRADAHSLSTETIGNSLRSAAATVVNAVASGVSTIVVARSLGTTAYGRYSYLLFVIFLVGALLDLGFNSRGMSVLVRAYPAGETEVIGRELRLLLSVGVVRGLFLAVAVFVVFHGSTLPMVLAASSIVLSTITAGLGLYLVAQRRYRVLSWSSVAVSVAQSAATSAVAITTRDAALTVSVFFAGQLITVLVVAALAPWSLILRPAPRATRPQRASPRTLISFYIAGTGQLLIFGQSEFLILRFFHQPYALGLFAIAATLAARATLFTDALYGALLPSVGAASTRSVDGVGRAYATSIRFSAILVLATTAVLGPPVIVFGPLVLGSHTASVRGAAALTLGGSLLQTFVYPLGSIATVEIQRRALVLPALMGAVSDIVLSIALIPSFGVYGAAVASLAAAAVFCLSLVGLVKTPALASSAVVSQLGRVGSVIVVLVALGVLSEHLSAWLALLIMWPVLVLAYALCRLGGGVLTRDDLTRLRGVTDRSRFRPVPSMWRVARMLLLVAPVRLVGDEASE